MIETITNNKGQLRSMTAAWIYKKIVLGQNQSPLTLSVTKPKTQFL